MNERVLQNVLPHIDAYARKNSSGVEVFFQIYPHTVARGYSENYSLHIPSGDYIGPDPGGNEVYEPYYSWGGAVVELDYDWKTNPECYKAILCENVNKIPK